MTTPAPQAVPGINFETLLPWFRAHVAPVDALEAEVIGHGRSNITYRLKAGGEHWVLRRPPLSHVLPTAHDMKREFRVISAMDGTDVPAPKAIALCEDPAVNDRPFYIMEFVDGFIPVDPRQVAERFDEAGRRHMGEHLIDVLARLHALDPEQVGLGDFGKPQGFIARQVKRFTGQIETITRPVPELVELSRRLSANIPDESGAAIVHGDYRIDNCVMNDAGEVIAVLDWEMATRGDPLADMGLLQMYWGDAGSVGIPAPPNLAATPVISLPGFPSWAEAKARYAAQSGRSIESLDYYVVLAHFKLAVILEGIRERFQEGGTVGEGFEGMAQRATALAQSGLRVADASEVQGLRG